MVEKRPRQSSLQGLLTIACVVLMVSMFAGSILCMAWAYRTWRGSVVKVHRGLEAPQREYLRLSDAEKDRIYALMAGAAGSAVVGLGLLAALKGRTPRRP
jgi:hypothetical protein